MSGINHIIERLKDWGNNCEHVDSIVLIGSLSKNLQDQWSDIDLLVFCKSPEVFFSDKTWVENIYPAILCYNQYNPKENMQYRTVLFENNVEMDFTPIKSSEINLAYFFTKIYSSIFGSLIPSKIKKTTKDKINAFNEYTLSGEYILVDKCDLEKKKDYIKAKLPYQGNYNISHLQFEDNLQAFWHQILREYKRLQRGDFYASKECGEYHSRTSLRQMIEWHTKLQYGWDYNTYYNGKKIESWADNTIIKKLALVYGEMNYDSGIRALNEAAKLYRYLSNIVAERIGYSLDKTDKTSNNIRAIIQLNE